MVRTKFTVTQEDINDGFNERQSNFVCPIALAMKRKLGARDIIVGGTFVYVDSEQISFPPNLLKWSMFLIGQAIIEQDVKPITFYLDIP